MPGEDGLWRDDGRDLCEKLATEQNALGCQAAAVVIREWEALPRSCCLSKLFSSRR
jgi:hypothetical protein